MKLIIKAENLEELETALESIMPLFLDGFKEGVTQNGCQWNIEEKRYYG